MPAASSASQMTSFCEHFRRLAARAIASALPRLSRMVIVVGTSDTFAAMTSVYHTRGPDVR
jgi:hypothetical protein